MGARKLVSTARHLGAPRRLRAFVRAHETSLVVLAALIGTVGGMVVLAMSLAVAGLHTLLFDIPIRERLSSQESIDPLRALLVPSLSGQHRAESERRILGPGNRLGQGRTGPAQPRQHSRSLNGSQSSGDSRSTSLALLKQIAAMSDQEKSVMGYTDAFVGRIAQNYRTSLQGAIGSNSATSLLSQL